MYKYKLCFSNSINTCTQKLTWISASMAARLAIVASLLCAALLLSKLNLSECTTDVVRGKVSCLDCNDKIFDLSGIKVAVKCDKTKKLWTAMTEDDGSFEVAAEIPTSKTCLAKILGGPHQIYASRKTMVSQVVKKRQEKEVSDYTTSTPLGIYSSCPEKSCSSEEAGLGASKTIDFPLPIEWGLAPSSYYFPFLPIIGIP